MDKVRGRETQDRKTSTSARQRKQDVSLDRHNLSSTADRVCSLHSRDDRRGHHRPSSSESFLRHTFFCVIARFLLIVLCRDHCTPRLHWERSDGPVPRLETVNGGLT